MLLASSSFYVDPSDVCALSGATILLARHASHDEVGKVLSGRSAIPINPAGRAEAMRLARRLVDVPLAAIYSSPRRRAQDTAAIVAEPRGVTVETADGLDEIDFGEWQGRSFDDLDGDPDWARWNMARASAATPGGETMHAATKRAVRHIEAVAGAAPVLCVSHCDIIRGVVAHYLGLDADRLLAFDVDPASLTELAVYSGGARVVSLNERPR
ncbi:histidine phosphatase family protein [Sphingomonas radiodurans]|uniref:histidine phosphatase family protein n=1 Tax=Sphingomonas radiodurans TaxID=2890321 RepID=UPI001E28B4EF|nr:histidine phosphatase family protein [Sphingomonas radiodurans]WBH18148.1 histidine phosphatase family protein [Sphingomonas radiodurans]